MIDIWSPLLDVDLIEQLLSVGGNLGLPHLTPPIRGIHRRCEVEVVDRGQKLFRSALSHMRRLYGRDRVLLAGNEIASWQEPGRQWWRSGRRRRRRGIRRVRRQAAIPRRPRREWSHVLLKWWVFVKLHQISLLEYRFVGSVWGRGGVDEEWLSCGDLGCSGEVRHDFGGLKFSS